MKKIAINGFGRIGRMVFRQLFNDKNIDIVAINDLTDTKTLSHLLKYDTAHGHFKGEVSHTKDALIVNGKKILVIAERKAIDLPWKKLKIDAVIESTGFYTSKEASEQHIKAGAKKVVISAPASGNLKTIVYSVNHKDLNNKDKIISAASCTTNALAPIAHVLDKNFGIVKGFMTTVHSFTGDQRLQDAPHRDLRRARAGSQNIIPTSTGAAIAIGKVLNNLNGKLDGMAMRVPTITGSIVDLVVELKDPKTTVSAINAAMKKSASASLEYTEDPIVSSDIIGNTHGSIFDSLLTKEIKVNGKKLFKVISWYDNENSYVSQFVRTFKYFVLKVK